ncbi:MAG TPA: hypothetical protein VFK13_05710 [Gemmatimonadaceae bacterium]|nr:hypothetical protein [Gemmatimonadaceae bacterium]
MISVRVVALTLAVSAAVAIAAPRTASHSALSELPDTIPLVGHWRLDLARTHYGNGVDIRQRESFICDMSGPRLRCVIRSVRHDSRELVGKFAAVPDGPPAPVVGIPDMDSVRASRPNPSLLDATFSFHGTPVFAYRAYQSRDGRSLMIVSMDPVSRAVLTTVVVYERE